MEKYNFQLEDVDKITFEFILNNNSEENSEKIEDVELKLQVTMSNMGILAL